MIKKIIFSVISLLLGLVFIFSGLTKLYPIELFELTFIDIGVANWQTAPIISRLFIGIEFFLGVMLVFNIRLRKFTLKATIALLAVFTIYLFIQMYFEGNKGNCKCFGNYLVMTPLESIFKNLGMIAVAVLLLLIKHDLKYRFQKLLMILGIVASLSLPFILNPPDFIAAYQSQEETIGYKLELDTLYTSTDLKKPEVDLRKGKHIIAFMSLTCKHCRVAAYKIHIINKQNPEIPFYFVLNGNEKNLVPFFDDTKTENIPYMMLLGERFVSLAGYNMPAIMFVNNSVVEQKENYISLNYDSVIEWLNKN
ncbi:MAG TPA: hypothetical protein PKN48_02240 [Bacteroidales bacterium]|nr:hypothetical protein [Bacteroidales bacterium]